MAKILSFIQASAKFLAAATGAAAVAVSLGLLSGDVQKWVTGGLAVATAFVVYLVKNVPPSETPPMKVVGTTGPFIPPTPPPAQ